MTGKLCAVFLPLSFATIAACASPGERLGSVENAPAAPAYFVTVSDATPKQAAVRLTLPARTGGPENWTLISHAPKLNIRSQIHEVRCDGAAIDGAGGIWPVPPECKTVSWMIHFISSTETTPADQQSAVTPSGWGVLSGPSSLLRLAPAPPTPPKVTILDKNGPPRDAALPPAGGPPAFFIIGAAPSLRAEANGVALNYVGEDLGAIATDILLERHLKGIEYFKSLLGQELTRQAAELTVVWYGISRKQQLLSGAAGHDTLLMSYLLKEDDPSEVELHRPFVLALHEQFHQLSTISAPEWVNESLAQYYALKAARRIYPEQAAIQAIYNEEITGALSGGPGLLAVQRQVTINGDYRNYSQFYDLGSRFWAAIDAAIIEASKGELSLDGYLSAIAQVTFDNTATDLPVAFFEALSLLDEEELRAITRAYL